jgi:hypothetical protein
VECNRSELQEARCPAVTTVVEFGSLSRSFFIREGSSVSTTTLTVSENVVQRLHQLSVRAGQPEEAVLDRALADYEAKLLAGDRPPTEPRASCEAELLDDPGRIRMPPRNPQEVTVRVVNAGRGTPRLRWEDD